MDWLSGHGPVYFRLFAFLVERSRGQFRQELLEVMSEPMGRQYYGGRERQETDEAKAERILAAELKRRQWDGDELKDRRKGDKEKVKMARRLRSETTMTLEWIARKLAMGASGYAAQCLRHANAKKHSVLRVPFCFWYGDGRNTT